MPNVDAPVASPLLGLNGAVPADPDSLDLGVAWHYGDPLREQRRLDAGEGFVDLSHRGVIRVDGVDRLSWLHSLLSQHVEHLEVGVGTEALLLSPHGHVERHMHLVDDGTSTWIHTEPGSAQPLAEFLDRMRFMLRVEVHDVSDERAVVWFPNADTTPIDGAIVVRARRGVHHLVMRGDLETVAETVGSPAGTWAHEALRVAAHEPRLNFETDHRTIPHEVGWIETAVHLQKGCYRGQETVARVHNLGRPPRRLVALHLDGSAQHVPTRHSEITAEGRTLGFVGTAVHHYELGPIALGVIKRNVPVDVALLADGVDAAQEVVVAP